MWAALLILIGLLLLFLYPTREELSEEEELAMEQDAQDLMDILFLDEDEDVF